MAKIDVCDLCRKHISTWMTAQTLSLGYHFDRLKLTGKQSERTIHMDLCDDCSDRIERFVRALMPTTPLEVK